MTARLLLATLAALTVAATLTAAHERAAARGQQTSMLYPRPTPLSALSLPALEKWQRAALTHYRGNLAVHERVADHRPLSNREAIHRHWLRAAVKWTSRELFETRARIAAKRAAEQPDWVAIQIHYATLIAQAALREGSPDPWPNCPDPFFNGASWQDTVNCENGGQWLDSPGYYRCGLQFDPSWERLYGTRFCP